MKVLLIGNNEFIAESLIKGFLIEKDKIMLVGSLDMKKIDSLVADKIKYYPIDIASDKCEDLFVVNNPDVVVYFDNAYEDLDNDMTEAQKLDHINNLINAHYYALKAKVSRFVYVSTIKLSDPLNYDKSEWYQAHKSCELFLKDFDTHQTTKCIILRTSELYGYGYDTKYSIITRLIQNRIYEKEDNSLDMTNMYDFIHVDDFCAAIRRSLQLYKSYTLNIASGYKVSLDIVKKVIENIDWVDNDLIESARQKGENIKDAKTLVGYSPSIDLLNGLKDVYQEEMDFKNNLIGTTFAGRIRNLIRIIRRKSQKRIDVTNHLLNIALGCLMIFFINKGYTNINGLIDIKLLYVLIIVIFFDFRQAMIAAFFSIVVTAYQHAMMEESMIMVLYKPELVEEIFILAIAGLGGGLVRQRNLDRIARHERNENALREQYTHVKKMYYESLVVKDSLQGQLYNSSNSFGRVFSIMSQMESLELTSLQYQIIEFAEEIMQNRYISFYLVNRSSKYLRLVSKSETLVDLPATIIVDNSSVIQQVIKTHKMYVNKSVDKNNDIVMASPMFYTNRVVAILIMHKANVEDLTLAYANMFKITASLANQAFNKAYAYHNAQEDELYIEGTEVLKVEPFSSRLKIVSEQIKEGKTTAALLDIGNRKSKKYFEKIRALVRDVDYVGLSNTGSVLILLNGIKKNDIIRVQDRLKNNGIDSRILELSGWAN